MWSCKSGPGKKEYMPGIKAAILASLADIEEPSANEATNARI
jgi:hypothetical protein